MCSTHYHPFRSLYLIDPQLAARYYPIIIIIIIIIITQFHIGLLYFVPWMAHCKSRGGIITEPWAGKQRGRGSESH